MTTNESPYTPTVTASGSLSHRTCSHDATSRERHNCRYESAKARMAAPKPKLVLNTVETATFGNLN